MKPKTIFDELQLIKKMAEGDMNSFDAIYWKYYKAVHGNILKLVQDNASAEDILQDVFLFADTIHNNISLNNKAITSQEIQQAATQSGVSKFIDSLPGKFQYNVKERGVMLSSGQRQLIAFLRAYVSNPGILILDEATSSVDSYSEQMIQTATDTITKDRTSIVIAHRLATIKKADKILVMDAGKIVESGTHKELLDHDGYYRTLYKVQFAAEKNRED